jgi:hypothetical protein
VGGLLLFEAVLQDAKHAKGKPATVWAFTSCNFLASLFDSGGVLVALAAFDLGGEVVCHAVLLCWQDQDGTDILTKR